jgi:hypothetical protein
MNKSLTPVAPVIQKDESAPPCLTFKDRDGFAAWLDAYERGTDAAVKLAENINLPARAEMKLVNDMRQSLNTGLNPAFICALTQDGKNVVWTMEATEDGKTECRDMFYVSIDGTGTVSDLTSTGRTTDCAQLCKPKRQEQNLLMWQCDLREKDGKKKWSQMHMDRATGKTELSDCQKDGLGMPVGCVE